jgi:hypothetical protein
MAQTVTNWEAPAGFITVTFDSGPPVQFPIADMLRAAEILVLTSDRLD